MNVTLHHTAEQLLERYKKESNSRLARRIHGVYVASNGMTYSEIIKVTGAGRRTIQKWVRR